MDPITAAVLGWGAVGGIGAGTNWFGLGGKKKDKTPAVPDYAALYQSFLDPRASEYTGILGEFGKSRLSPDYQAMTPAQQNMIFSRIQEQLAPEFERQMKGQEQSIFSQGITGTPGAGILGKLRQDYLKDLSGRSTDIAIENIGLTEQGRQYGGNILSNLRSSLVGEAQSAAGMGYGGQMQGYQNAYNQYLQGQQQDQALWGGIGSLAGNVGSNLLYDYMSPTKGMEKKLMEALIGKLKA